MLTLVLVPTVIVTLFSTLIATTTRGLCICTAHVHTLISCALDFPRISSHTLVRMHNHVHVVNPPRGYARVGRAILPVEGDDDGLLISSKVGVLELYTVGRAMIVCLFFAFVVVFSHNACKGEMRGLRFGLTAEETGRRHVGQSRPQTLFPLHCATKSARIYHSPCPLSSPSHRHHPPPRTNSQDGGKPGGCKTWAKEGTQRYRSSFLVGFRLVECSEDM